MMGTAAIMEFVYVGTGRLDSKRVTTGAAPNTPYRFKYIIFKILMIKAVIETQLMKSTPSAGEHWTI